MAQNTDGGSGPAPPLAIVANQHDLIVRCHTEGGRSMRRSIRGSLRATATRPATCLRWRMRGMVRRQQLE
jgi:hypothetical protein